MERQNSLQTDGHSSDRQGRSSQTPMWKAVLVGEEGVGKTSLFQRLYRNRFVEHFRSTIGMDQGELTVTHEASGKVCRFSLWDTAGSERHASITLSYYRNSVVVLLVFSLDSQLSLPKLRNWVADAKMFSPTACLFLIGNKMDVASSMDEDLASISAEAAEHFWKSEFPNDIKALYRVSAKTGDGIAEAMQGVCGHVLQAESEPSRKKAASDPAREDKLVDKSVLELDRQTSTGREHARQSRSFSCC